MKYTDHPVATVDEVHALLNRLSEMYEPDFMDAEQAALKAMEDNSGWKRASEYMNKRHAAFESGLRYTIAQAGALLEPSLVAPIVNLLWVSGCSFESELNGHSHYICMDLALAIKAGPREIEPLNMLSQMDATNFRVLAGQCLDPHQPGQRRILERLLKDTQANVRKAARETLSKVKETLWWEGRFIQDPATRLDEAQLLEAKEAIEAACTLSEGSIGGTKSRQKLREVIKALPDALACDLCEVFLRDSRLALYGDQCPAGLLASKQGGLDVVLRLMSVWTKDQFSYKVGEDLGKALTGLDIEKRRVFCASLLATIDKRKHEMLRNRFSDVTLSSQCAMAIAVLWPNSDDPSPLIDLFEALPEPEPNALSTAYTDLLSPIKRVDVAVVPWERLASMHPSGWGENWTATGLSTWRSIMERAPSSFFNPLSASLLRGEGKEDFLNWMVGCLIGDRGEAQDHTANLASLMASPLSRSAIFKIGKQKREPIFDGLWEAMLEQTLSLAESRTLMNDLFQIHTRSRLPTMQELIMMGISAERNDFESHRPPKASEPLDNARWSAWRVVRAAHEGEEDFWMNTMGVLPRDVEDWDASDHAFVDRARETILQDPTKANNSFIDLAVALATRDGADASEAIDALFKHSNMRKDLYNTVRVGFAHMFGLGEAPEPADGDDLGF